MYDIYFELDDMHQLVEEDLFIDSSPQELSQLYNELVAMSKDDDEFWAINLDAIDHEADEDDDDFAVIVRNPHGLTCKSCNEIYPYAEPNLKNGGFKCWSCRNT